MGNKIRKTSTNMRDALLFIDTCIFLDFYRAKGPDGKLAILDLIDNNHDRIITGEQVEMEYKKNRRALILKAVKSFKMPEWGTLDVPAFLEETQAAKMIEKRKAEIKKQVKRITDQLKKVLEKPGDYDPVYQCLQRLFKAGGPCNLTRKNKEERLRNRIHSLARKRYVLGYPPRKPEDTSCGDGVNWEWIVHCATKSDRNIIIVSRDGDYGTSVDGKSAINDWLSWEFKDRISQQRGVILTNRLTAAFKMAAIAVTPEQVKEEDSMMEARSEAVQKIPAIPRVASPEERWQQMWDNLQALDPSSRKTQTE